MGEKIHFLRIIWQKVSDFLIFIYQTLLFFLHIEFLDMNLFVSAFLNENSIQRSPSELKIQKRKEISFKNFPKRNIFIHSWFMIGLLSFDKKMWKRYRVPKTNKLHEKFVWKIIFVPAIKQMTYANILCFHELRIAEFLDFYFSLVTCWDILA